MKDFYVYIHKNKTTGEVFFRVNYKDATGKIKTKNFSINKLGEENALKLAIEFRNLNL